MVRSSFARKVLTQAALIGTIATVAGINCSPASTDSAADRPNVVCTSTAEGSARIARFGATRVELRTHGRPGEHGEELKIERAGAVLLSSTNVVSRRTSKDDTVVQLELHYGGVFVGPHDFVLVSIGGGAFTGTVDGRAISPFTGGKSFKFADGSDVPVPQLDDEKARAEIDRSIAAIASQDACGESGATKQPVTSPIGASLPGGDSCELCRFGCWAAGSASLLAGSATCMLFLPWCPVCWAGCQIALIGVLVGEEILCMGACNRSAYCQNQGPRCGTRYNGDEYRCEYDEQCLDSVKHLCCPSRTGGCGSTCCEYAKGESCARMPSGALGCCVPPSKDIAGECCPADRQQKSPTGADVCCNAGTPVCADGSCCTLGGCVDGKCCAKACGTSCCGDTETCLGGSCCPSERSCGGGSFCCPSDKICSSDGVKCVPPSSISCPTGTVPKTDQAAPGSFVCCPSSNIGCNGACCGTVGQQCCPPPSGGAYSCRTDCIR